MSDPNAKLRIRKKGTKMIATAIAIQEATKDAVHDDMSMAIASQLLHARNEMSDNDFAQMLFKYSALLSSLTATLVTNVLLTESEMDAMINEINEFDNLGKDITDGN
jgi:hypothetical protein